MTWFIAAGFGALLLFFMVLALILHSDLDTLEGVPATSWWNNPYVPAPIIAWLACVIVVCLIMGVWS